MKTCTGCGVSKPLADFHKRSSAQDGRNTRCRKCKNAANNKHYPYYHRKTHKKPKPAKLPTPPRVDGGPKLDTYREPVRCRTCGGLFNQLIKGRRHCLQCEYEAKKTRARLSKVKVVA